MHTPLNSSYLSQCHLKLYLQNHPFFNKMRKVGYLMILMMAQSSLSFTAFPLFSNKEFASKRHQRSLGISKQSEILLDVSKLKNCNVELWLDMREISSLSPKAALEHLQTDVWEKYVPSNDPSKPCLVDKVLTKHHTGVNINSIVHSLKQEYESKVRLMVHEKEDSIHEINDKGIMLPCGKVVNVELGKGGITNLNADPMPVLEPVSRGDWVVLDGNENVDDDSISSLVEIVTDGVDAFGALDDSTLRDKSSLGLSSGGIGLSCSSQASVMEVGAIIASLVGRKKYEITDSGIIIQSQTPENSERTTYAIVMPFDSLLWKTSSFFLLQ